MKKCPQCNDTLVEPRESEPYCETCGYPYENRAVFTLVEIKAYLRSMFESQNCTDDISQSNERLAFAFNLLTDDVCGIVQFCDAGKAEGLKLSDFTRVRIE